MFKKMLKMVSVVLLAVTFATPMFAPIFAQEDTELSEEELALLERIIAAQEIRDNLAGYAFVDDKLTTTDMTLTASGQELKFLTTEHQINEGYLLQEGDIQSESFTFTLEFDGQTGGEITQYVATGDAVFVEDVLYVEMGYESSEGEVEPLAEGWQHFSAEEELPEILSDFDFDDLFDEDDTNPLDKLDTLQSAITGITLTEETLEDGTTVDVITITLDKEGFMAILQATSSEEELANFGQLFGAENAELNMTVNIALDENNQYMYSEMLLDFTVSGLDGGMFDLPNTTLAMTMSSHDRSNYSGYDETFDPIVAPEMGDTVEPEATEEQ